MPRASKAIRTMTEGETIRRVSTAAVKSRTGVP